MSAVYSTRFLAGNVTTSAPRSYTVPTGFIAVVRSITLAITGSGTGSLTAVISGVGDLSTTGVQSAGYVATDNMRQVLNAGDVLQVNASSGTGLAVISGYLLSTP